MMVPKGQTGPEVLHRFAFLLEIGNGFKPFESIYQGDAFIHIQLQFFTLKHCVKYVVEICPFGDWIFTLVLLFPSQVYLIPQSSTIIMDKIRHLSPFH